jgi:hypothetical protein
MQIDSPEARSTIAGLSAARWRVAVVLTAAMMVVLLIGVYARWADNHYDMGVARLRELQRS